MRRCIQFPMAGFAAIGLLASLTAGCTTAPYTSPEQQAQNACQAVGPKALSGALIGGLGGAASGAALGAIAGNGRGAAIGAGAGLLVGLIGGLAVGHNMDARDCAAAQQALAQLRGLPTGNQVTWHGPAGSSGVYQAVTDETPSPDGGFCRIIRQQTTLPGHEPTFVEGKTCRTSNGDYVSVQPANT